MKPEPAPHVVVAGPGQWGQQAIDNLLHRVVARGGAITLIVPRRDQWFFENVKPSYAGWNNSASVAAHVQELRTAGLPVGYVYDDHLSHLAADLIAEQSSGEYNVIGYVTSAAEDHYPFAKFLTRVCKRVLVEKPIGKFASEVASDGAFVKLAKEAEDLGCTLRAADHFLFRPGITQALEASEHEGLSHFLRRHRDCPLRYEFRFCEEAAHDDPNLRLGAYQDGAILDVLMTHGLGPVTQLVLPEIDPGSGGGLDAPDSLSGFPDLDRDLSVHAVRTWRAVNSAGKPQVSVLTETAAVVEGVIWLSGGRRLRVHLASVKGHSGYDRYFRVSCPVEGCCRHDLGGPEERKKQLASIPIRRGGIGEATADPVTGQLPAYMFAVSLGKSGLTVVDVVDGGQVLYVERNAGYRSDQRASGASWSANAQAAMLDRFLDEQKFDDPKSRFLPVPTACAIVRVGLEAQAAAQRAGMGHGKKGTYLWQQGPNSHALEPAACDPSRLPALTDNSGTAPGTPGDTYDELLAIMGIASEGQPVREHYRRLVTVLAPEGSGKYEVSRELLERLQPAFGSEFESNVVLHHVPRHAAVAEDVDARRFVLDQLCRRVARATGITLPAGERASTALTAYLSPPKEMERRRAARPGVGFMHADRAVLMLYGIDRVPTDVWPEFVDVVAAIPPSVRLVFFSKRNDRAPGHVVRPSDFGVDTFVAQRIDECWSDQWENIADDVSHRRALEALKRQIEAHAGDNPAVARALARVLYHCELPRLLGQPSAKSARKRLEKAKSDRVDEVLQSLRRYLAALALPRPLVSFPARALDRIARSVLAHLGPEAASVIQHLAHSPGPLPRRVLDTIFPGLVRRVRRGEPIAAVFSLGDDGTVRLHPEFRRMGAEMDLDECLRVRDDVMQRYVTLTLSAPDEERSAIVVEALLRADLGSYDLSQAGFGALVEDLFARLTVSARAPDRGALQSLVARFTERDPERATNLSLLAQARTAYLNGRALEMAAGRDWARANPGLAQLRKAYWVSARCVEITNAAPTPGDDVFRHSQFDAGDTLLLTLQGWRLARLRQEGAYGVLVGLDRGPEPLDRHWEADEEQAAGTANVDPPDSPRKRWASLWVADPEMEPQGFAEADADREMVPGLQRVVPRPSTVPETTKAMLVGARALEFVLEGAAKRLEARDLCKDAARKLKNLDHAKQLRAMLLLEAAAIEESKGRRAKLLRKARNVGDLPPALIGYHDLIAYNRESTDLPELERIQSRLRAAGEPHLAEVAGAMIRAERASQSRP